jgi:uncharacterized protein (DUF111 family)
MEGKVVSAKPEFADCQNAADNFGVSVKAVINAAMKKLEI